MTTDQVHQEGRTRVTRDPSQHPAELHQWRVADLLEHVGAERGAQMLRGVLAEERAHATRSVAPLRKWPSNPPVVHKRHVRGPNLVRICRVLDYLVPGDRVFDVGTNYGYLSGVLLRDAELSAYTGIDVSDHQLDSVREMMAVNELGAGVDVRLAKCDLYDLTPSMVSESAPTLMLVLEVLEHVPDAGRALNTIAAALPDNTAVLLSVPLLGRLEGCWGHRSVFDHGRLLRLCADAGLWVHRVEPLHNAWTLVLAAPAREPLARTAAVEAAPWPATSRRRLPVYALRRVPLADQALTRGSARGRDIDRVRIDREPAAVSCDIDATDADEGVEAGVNFDVEGGLELLRVEMSVSDPTAVKGLRLEMLDAKRRRLSGWTWKPVRGGAKLPAKAFTTVLRPGLSGDPFTAEPAEHAERCSSVDIVAEIRPRTSVRLTVHRASYLSAGASG